MTSRTVKAGTPLVWTSLVLSNQRQLARLRADVIHSSRCLDPWGTTVSVVGWHPSERLSPAELHLRFCLALGRVLAEQPGDGALRTKPVSLVCQGPLPRRLRLYLFNATEHPSERRDGDYRIQLRLPGQRPRTRGALEMDWGELLVLSGYVAGFDVFVLWEPRAHQHFPYSKGVQVAASTVHRAAIHGLADQTRRVRTAGVSETVVAARSDRLVDGLQQREQLSRHGLLRDSDAHTGPNDSQESR